jgi:hypothetical protein
VGHARAALQQLDVISKSGRKEKLTAVVASGKASAVGAQETERQAELSGCPRQNEPCPSGHVEETRALGWLHRLPKSGLGFEASIGTLAAA